MRETCARVLAAALMTGAIATVVAMSALFETPGGLSRPIAAPPSSLHRSVSLAAQRARPHPKTVARLRASRPVNRPTRPVILTRSLVVVRTHRADPPPRRLASTKPSTKPKHKPLAASAPPAQPAAPQPPALPAAQAAPPAKAEDDQQHESDEEHGNGNGDDRGKSHKGHDGHGD